MMHLFPKHFSQWKMVTTCIFVFLRNILKILSLHSGEHLLFEITWVITICSTGRSTRNRYGHVLSLGFYNLHMKCPGSSQSAPHVDLQEIDMVMFFP